MLMCKQFSSSRSCTHTPHAALKTFCSFKSNRWWPTERYISKSIYNFCICAIEQKWAQTLEISLHRGHWNDTECVRNMPSWHNHAVVSTIFKSEVTEQARRAVMAALGPSWRVPERTESISGLTDASLGPPLVESCTKSQIALESLLLHAVKKNRGKELLSYTMCTIDPAQEHLTANLHCWPPTTTWYWSFQVTYVHFSHGGNNYSVACLRNRILFTTTWLRTLTAA